MIEFEAFLEKDRITGESIPGKVVIKDVSRAKESICFIPFRNMSKWKLKAGEECDATKLSAQFTDQWSVKFYIGTDVCVWEPGRYTPTPVTTSKRKMKKKTS